MLQTVYDLVGHDASLIVTCRNCGRDGKMTADFLRQRCGAGKRLDEINWRCVGCDGRNVRLGIGPASAATPPKIETCGRYY